MPVVSLAYFHTRVRMSRMRMRVSEPALAATHSACSILATARAPPETSTKNSASSLR